MDSLESLLGKIDLEKIFLFVMKINKLKETYRFSQVKNEKGDSTADHCRRLGMMGILFAQKMNLDYDSFRILMLAQCYDLAEIEDGDIDVSLVYNGKISREQKEQIEIENIKKVLNCLPSDLQKEVFDFWEDFRTSGSKEAKFMKALDKIEGVLHYIQKDFDYESMIAFVGYHGNKEVLNAPETKDVHKTMKKLLKQFFSEKGIERKKEYDEY